MGKKQGIPLPECPVVRLVTASSPGRKAERVISLVAVGELHGSDLGAPVEALRDHVELGGVPEGAVINRINMHGAVVAPALGRIRLGTVALDHQHL